MKNYLSRNPEGSPTAGIEPLPPTPEAPARTFTCSDTQLLTPKLDLDELYKSQSSENFSSPFGRARRVQSPRGELPPPVRVPLKDTNNPNIGNSDQKWTKVTPKKTHKGYQKRMNSSQNQAQKVYGGFGFGAKKGGHPNGKSKREENAKVLKSIGLPSMFDKKESTESGPTPSGPTPGYMQMTKAAKQRRANAHNR